MSSLEESLRLALASLSPALLADDERPAVRRLARALAPIHCAGFECRLAAGGGRVDLQQRVLAGWGEPGLLAATLEARGLAATPPWDRLAAFSRRWEGPGSFLRREVRGCWLEFDRGMEFDRGVEFDPPVPSVFLSLARLHETAADLERVVRRIVEPLVGEALPAPVLASLRRCAGACSGDAGVTDIGVMLSRDAGGLRVVTGHLPRDGVPGWLEAAGWTGDRRELTPALKSLPPAADPVAVSLDVGARVRPRIGLEYFPESGESGAGWGELLEHLTGRGLCRPDEAEALLAWPGRIHPPDAGGDWPWTLVVDSILEPARRFSVIERRLNHVKVVCRPGSPPSAKAYLGFGALWLEPDRPRAAGATGREARRRAPGAIRGRAERGAARAVSFLLGARDGDGGWRDFSRVMGGSDEWVTGYVGTSLAGVSGDEAREAAARAWRRLCECREGAGWGYNGLLPVDADATAWALRLAAGLGELEAPPARRAVEALLHHRRADGGLASYNAEAVPALRPFLDPGGGPEAMPAVGGPAAGADPAAGCAAYLRSHPCVTAAAALLEPCRESAAGYLEREQEADGRWEGYWWCDPAYATALAVDALAGPGRPASTGGGAGAGPASAARRWAAGRLEPGGFCVGRGSGRPSPFVTALCLRVLGPAGCEEPELAARGLAWLLDRQDDDGGWPASALMRVPPPDAHDADTRPAATFVGLDEARVFTTATVLTTLSRYVSSAE